ncbi:MAG: class I SAM-dependent methyltransferase, partial [Myxococcota bacterium]|nr:class I SAM-dependent methyltransferase [Myxococcota bacterium]
MIDRLQNDRFPRSSKYDPNWVFKHQMGPNALWLMEWLCGDMNLRPGMRVLDMGCGMAMSSIFLAREFDLQVWATDLWIPASKNLEHI